jgi:NAD(P)-dependent dehydrogenase (short-subunit alcohol dehydrogenase family)
LTDDGTPLTAGLAAGLTKLGWKAVVLSWPTGLVPASPTLPENIGRVTLEDLSEKSLEKAIEQVTEKYGTVGSFIHLNPRTSAGGVAFLEAEEQILKAIFLLARSLKKPLTEAGQHGRASFLTISRLDGKFGLDGQNYGAVGGGLFGLTKSLSQEWEKVHCRALDLSPELSDGQGVDYILAELYDPSRLMVEVAYSPEGRSTLVSEVAALNGRTG